MKNTVYAGTQNSLQFPVLSDAYVKLDYGNNIAGEPLGVWNHEGSFTIEMLVTPYDVNGYGNNTVLGSTNADIGKQTSSKTMPARALIHATTTQDVEYLPVTNRLAQEMVLFYNDNLDIRLVNKTTHTYNNPAEYAVKVSMTLGSTVKNVESAKAIVSRKEHLYTDSTDATTYLYRNYAAFAKESGYTVQAGGISGAVITTTGTNANRVFSIGDDVYAFDGVKLGRVLTCSSTSIGLESSITYTPVTDLYDTKIYLPVEKEALYLLSPYHIAVSYEDASKRISIFINGKILASGIHDGTDKFSFAQSTIYLGQNPTATTSQLKRNSQFMGEYHELSITNAFQDTFTSLYTIDNQYRNVLLYLDFEEVDE